MSSGKHIMGMRIDHIGIAITDLNAAVMGLLRLLSVAELDIQYYQNDISSYKITFINLGGIVLELIEPVTRKGMAQEHLDQFGPGVYHLALQVPGLDNAIKTYSAKGFECQPVRIGAKGERITFMKDQLLPGIYVEFVERKSLINCIRERLYFWHSNRKKGND